MSLPNAPRKLSRWNAFRRSPWADPWVAAGWIGGVLAIALLLVAESPGISRIALEFLLLGISLATLGALAFRRRRSPYLRERRFWGLAAAAQAAFVLARTLQLLVPAGAGETANLALGLFFVLMILAAETRPDRRRSADTSRLDALWVQPAAALFAAALWIYFLGVAYATQSSPAELDLLARLLFSTLGVYLCGRFWVLGLRGDSSRWRLQYGLFGLAFAAFLLADWLPGADGIRGSLGQAWIALGAWLPAVAAAFAAQAEGSDRRKPPAVNLDLSGAHRGTTLLWALVLPFAHVILHRLEWLPATDREAREPVMLITLGLLGAYAVAQRYWTELEAVRLWQEQRKAAQELRSSEQDLRLMVERNRGTRELGQSEKKFAAAFRLSPDGMLITTVREGEVIDANESYCRLLGLEPEQVIGRRTSELGLWRDEEERDSLILELLTRGAAPDKIFPADGARSLQASFELIFTGETKLMLITVRDVTDGASRRIELLHPATVAVFGTDADDRVIFWSRGAEELFGRTEEEVLGESAASFHLPRPTEKQDQRRLPTYRGRAFDGEGRPLRLTCHSTSLRRDDGTTGRLTFAGVSSRPVKERRKTSGPGGRRR